METGELTSGDIAVIAAGSALLTALVTNLVTHLSAASREARARNSEHLAKLVIEFDQDFKSFQKAFYSWIHAQNFKIRILNDSDLTGGPKPLNVESYKKTSDEVESRFTVLINESNKLDKYKSSLEIYAPSAVRDAYISVNDSVDKAINLAHGSTSDISDEIEAMEVKLEDQRRRIAEATRRELYVKSRRQRLRDYRLFKWLRDHRPFNWPPRTKPSAPTPGT
ncbi:hypothetical protein LTH96_03070 [Nesterenkonia sp. LB17]|uniref:hypothetical protein n=1 Tax=Nesterenkonia sp. LB17 TaxID=2901230 RepID=UPI001F4CF31D|nr:hypothetical protein [Nesterenkonia sp. LB17]MCH8564726.1 hypothetical protein [Nesterenkonia sp. LB17]